MTITRLAATSASQRNQLRVAFQTNVALGVFWNHRFVALAALGARLAFCLVTPLPVLRLTFFTTVTNVWRLASAAAL